ncbi:uncharacterized protein LOC123530094 [Mercenaria mercenaria]|uniref:uncharacterized protein LOC123530094 n=1 Tax=Mercenaria mercenaria TaxID=6596 RepID=UPI00234EB13B|nr:uncharacterized protein LOC123530094 [Mercenaria mercenaria]XP_045166729.2 uncharacterized protein LOC123530094 [Mercenaria mercenaria]XP_053378423.1 uncharacterized protein LOC123530094 [Mercenaria mercenaria]
MDAKVPLNPFVETKVRMWYRLHNKKRNGFMNRADFIEMTDSFIKEFKLDAEMAEEIRSWLVNGWTALIKFMKNSADDPKTSIPLDKIPTVSMVAEKLSKDGTITEDEYVKAYAESLQIDPSPFPACFSEMVSFFFKVFDTDKDGYLIEKDMVRGWRCFGIDNAKAVKAVFADLDPTGSGKVDRDTYVGAWMEYMTGMNKSAPIAKHFTPDIL